LAPRISALSKKRVGADEADFKTSVGDGARVLLEERAELEVRVASPPADERPLAVVAATDRERTGIRAAAGNSPAAATPGELPGPAQKAAVHNGSSPEAWTDSISDLFGGERGAGRAGVRGHPEGEGLQVLGRVLESFARFRGQMRFRADYALRPPREAPSGLRLAPAGPRFVAALGERGERRRGARGGGPAPRSWANSRVRRPSEDGRARLGGSALEIGARPV
jgi:hypothetical protein